MLSQQQQQRSKGIQDEWGCVLGAKALADLERLSRGPPPQLPSGEALYGTRRKRAIHSAPMYRCPKPWQDSDSLVSVEKKAVQHVAAELDAIGFDPNHPKSSVVGHKYHCSPLNFNNTEARFVYSYANYKHNLRQYKQQERRPDNRVYLQCCDKFLRDWKRLPSALELYRAKYDEKGMFACQPSMIELIAAKEFLSHYRKRHNNNNNDGRIVGAAAAAAAAKTSSQPASTPAQADADAQGMCAVGTSFPSERAKEDNSGEEQHRIDEKASSQASSSRQKQKAQRPATAGAATAKQKEQLQQQNPFSSVYRPFIQSSVRPVSATKFPFAALGTHVKKENKGQQAAAAAAAVPRPPASSSASQQQQGGGEQQQQQQHHSHHHRHHCSKCERKVCTKCGHRVSRNKRQQQEQQQQEREQH